MWKSLVKIQIHSFQSIKYIPRYYEENLNKLFGWLNRLSILVWLIEKENPIDRKEFSIGRKIKEIHHKVSGWLDQFLIPVRLIEWIIWSIEGNSRSIETLETKFSRIFTKQFSTIFHEQTTFIWT